MIKVVWYAGQAFAAVEGQWTKNGDDTVSAWYTDEQWLMASSVSDEPSPWAIVRSPDRIIGRAPQMATSPQSTMSSVVKENRWTTPVKEKPSGQERKQQGAEQLSLF